MKAISFLRGCAIAIFGFAFARLWDPLFGDKPYNSHVDWLDVSLVVGFGFIFLVFLDKSRGEKDIIAKDVKPPNAI